MGTGPATNLAASRNVGGLIMISGYTSIKSVVKDYAGSFAKCLISERFENIQKIKSVNCPILLIHGLLDKLIPYKHSMELKSKVNPSVHCEIFLSLTMTHNDFNVETDFLEPIKDFFKRAKVLIKNGNEEILKLPQEIKDPPRNIFRKGKSFLSLLYTKFKIT